MLHHTLICPSTPEVGCTASDKTSSVGPPVVFVQINGKKFRVLDNGASNTYVSQTLINATKAQPVKTSTHLISTL